MFSFSDRGVMAGLVVATLLVTGIASGQEVPTVTDPSKTISAERSPGAPRELDVFAFLIGKWDGRGRTRLPDGKVAEYPVAWVGRYILDGTAIADEIHGSYPDGTPVQRSEEVPGRLRGPLLGWATCSGGELNLPCPADTTARGRSAVAGYEVVRDDSGDHRNVAQRSRRAEPRTSASSCGWITSPPDGVVPSPANCWPALIMRRCARVRPTA